MNDELYQAVREFVADLRHNAKAGEEPGTASFDSFWGNYCPTCYPEYDGDGSPASWRIVHAPGCSLAKLLTLVAAQTGRLMGTRMSWQERAPGLYRLSFQLADGRWWQALVQANDYAEAERVARTACPEPGAPLLLNDRTDEPLDALVLATETATPRDWEG